jgi:hypothetical protein
MTAPSLCLCGDAVEVILEPVGMGECLGWYCRPCGERVLAPGSVLRTVGLSASRPCLLPGFPPAGRSDSGASGGVDIARPLRYGGILR